MESRCPICDDTGFRVVRHEDGMQFAAECDCRLDKRLRRLIGSARIPRRFEDCSIESYSTFHPSSNKTLEHALNTAKHFVEGFPLETKGKGVLFVGPRGLGKTHLSVSILKSLILDRGASGVFWEHKELMEAFRSAMFGTSEPSAESRVLHTVLRSDVLVLDDLGDLSRSEWTYDTTSHILNSRYNENLCTIITTNFENLASLSTASESVDVFAQKREGLPGRRLNTGMTLGDRIGDRMWSRIQEMCVVVEMHGEDFRQKVKRASFA